MSGINAKLLVIAPYLYTLWSGIVHKHSSNLYHSFVNLPTSSLIIAHTFISIYLPINGPTLHIINYYLVNLLHIKYHHTAYTYSIFYMSANLPVFTTYWPVNFTIFFCTAAGRFSPPSNNLVYCYSIFGFLASISFVAVDNKDRANENVFWSPHVHIHTMKFQP